MVALRREAASAYIWALVSGLPGEQRRRRALLMLQAYIDDSKTDGKLFVLGGYIARAEAWAEFSDEWAAELERNGIVEFKMTKMIAHPERSQKFYRIIEKHVLGAVSVTLPLAHIEAALEGLVWPYHSEGRHVLRSPYWIAFQAMIQGLASNAASMKLTEPVDFIFDEQSEVKHVEGVWDDFKRMVPPEVLAFVGDRPIWRPSTTYKPLQAADLYAWWIRRWEVEGVKDAVVTLPFNWERSRIAPVRVHCPVDLENLRSNYVLFNQRIWDTFAATNLHLNPQCVSSPPWSFW